ncbi:MAG: site-specific DNA-methyltransferase [Bacteroidales bacterium]|nr:site-specific DNA-methyltransferase [Bacteroidales bacterium]
MQISDEIFKILQGDSRDILKDIKSNSVQCIITSPPYWGLRDYHRENQIGLEPLLDEYLSQLEIVFNELYRILKPNGVLFLVIGDGYTSGNRKYRAIDKKNPSRLLAVRPDTPPGLKNKELIGIPWKLAFLLQKNGWYLRNDIIWHKPNAMPESVKDRPYRCHEYIFMFSKLEKYFFDLSKLKDANHKLLRSVWAINTSSKSAIHSATFPLELVKYCIYSSTKPKDIVLDPFCGIGTVGIACVETNRGFLGIDINDLYINEAIQNIKEII